MIRHPGFGLSCYWLMEWRFLTNHGRALLCLAHAQQMRHRDLALLLGITERSAQKIVRDLVKAGYVSSERVGRRNVYEVHTDRPLPLGLELSVGDLLAMLSVEEKPAGEIPLPPAR